MSRVTLRNACTCLHILMLIAKTLKIPQKITDPCLTQEWQPSVVNVVREWSLTENTWPIEPFYYWLNIFKPDFKKDFDKNSKITSATSQKTFWPSTESFFTVEYIWLKSFDPLPAFGGLSEPGGTLAAMLSSGPRVYVTGEKASKGPPWGATKHRDGSGTIGRQSRWVVTHSIWVWNDHHEQKTIVGPVLTARKDHEGWV